MITEDQKQKIIDALEIGFKSAIEVDDFNLDIKEFLSERGDIEKIKDALEIIKGLVCE
jgi:hypothetical protein